MTEARIQELDRAWDESDRMDDDEYRDWYEELTEEERQLIDAWDERYRKGVLRLCEDIRGRGEHENRPD